VQDATRSPRAPRATAASDGRSRGASKERPGDAAGGADRTRGGGGGAQEPIWFVRLVLLLFFAAAAGFLAREVWDVVQALSQ
jgi:hypothetical protein